MPARQLCNLEPAATPEPCIIVIFGASGDLTSRKLIPALFSMYDQGKMPDPFSIVGCSRSAMSDTEFREHLFSQLQDQPEDVSRWQDFAQNLHYQTVTYDTESFGKLADFLQELDRNEQTAGNRVFDLAVPPKLYPRIAELLGQSGLSREEDRFPGWARIIVEKPFGHDLESAIALNNTLHEHFKEEQIFRIDHYMAKETVQNTLILRFANSIFEPLWNRHHVEYIGIMASEELGVGNRAGYYEHTGVLRDMFQNHLMQLLVLTAMEPPYRYEANAVQDEKAKVIRSLRKFSIEQGSRIVLGQYSEGTTGGSSVPGYRDEKGVDSRSPTPTFAFMELFIDNWRWQDVPFYLISGKRLRRKKTRIIIQFKKVPHLLFKDILGEDIGANRLVIETYPEEAIRLIFQTKDPGMAMCLHEMTMDFVYHEHYQKITLDAYARVLLDCIAGDHMLFWRQDGIELSWSFLTPVLQECEECPSPERQLHFYPAGSWGPEAVQQTMNLLIDE